MQLVYDSYRPSAHGENEINKTCTDKQTTKDKRTATGPKDTAHRHSFTFVTGKWKNEKLEHCICVWFLEKNFHKNKQSQLIRGVGIKQPCCMKHVNMPFQTNVILSSYWIHHLLASIILWNRLYRPFLQRLRPTNRLNQVVTIYPVLRICNEDKMFLDCELRQIWMEWWINLK